MFEGSKTEGMKEEKKFDSHGSHGMRLILLFFYILHSPSH